MNLAQSDAWRRGIKGAFWPTSFWDHFLRGDERLEQVVEYVRNNPRAVEARGAVLRRPGFRVEPAGDKPPPYRTPAGDKPPPYSEN